MNIPQSLPRCFLFLLFCSLLIEGCQHGTTEPSVEFTKIPVSAVGGLDKMDTNRGKGDRCSPRTTDCFVCQEQRPLVETAVRSRSVIHQNPEGFQMEERNPFGRGVCRSVGRSRLLSATNHEIAAGQRRRACGSCGRRRPNSRSFFAA